MPTAEELKMKIEEAEYIRLSAQERINSIKKQLINAENDFIAAKLMKENLVEELRINKLRSICVDISERTQEIETFRLNHPDLCELARQRDLTGQKEDPDGTGHNF